MNIGELFEMQKKLDKHIVEEKRLAGQDLLAKKVLALQVELGELCNNWRGFKFWSENQKPKREIKCHCCNGEGDFLGKEICLYCEGTGVQARPLLEEYVDCLHFFLSIANTIELPEDYLYGVDESLVGSTETVFIELFYYISKTMFEKEKELKFTYFKVALWIFNSLGEQRLGLDWEKDIVPAYLEKNKVNHKRQETGY